MSISKENLNNFLPNGFETENKEDYKMPFDEDLVQTGYERDVPDIVSGPNLNNLIDVVGKNTNILNKYVEYLNGMPINNVPTVNKFNQLDYTNLDDKLTKNQITNCLLEVPQRIKLELNDGTLTLKAGSQVIIPNGFEADGTTPKFDYVTIESDKSSTLKGNVVTYPIYNPATSSFRDHIGQWESGATRPSGTAIMWYDTASNIVRYTNDGWVTEITGLSLPTSKCTCTSSGYTSINQVFNGMGYIGSTFWVDKGVKGLIPNGRNEDGSLNNVEFTTQNMLLRNNTEKGSWYLAILNNGTRVSIANKKNWNLDEKSNRILDGGVIRDNIGFYGDVTLDTGGIITSFNPKQPFRAVDYSDSSTVSGWGMPSNRYIDLTLGADGSTYTAPANGYFTLNKFCGISSGNGYIVLIVKNKSIEENPAVYNSPNAILRTFVPVQKNDVVTVSYNAKGTTNYFRFIYAEGSK